MITDEQRESVYDAWRVAADALSIRIQVPYLLKTPDGEEVLCAAYLPDFGGPRGMVFGLWDHLAHLGDKVGTAAKSQGLYFSRINPEVYDYYDEEVFVEALTDWGFFGSEDDRPKWLWKRSE